MADCPSDRVRLTDQGYCLVQEAIAGHCKAHFTGRSLEEFHPQGMLQPADQARQRRLRDVQALGGAVEIQLLGHGDERSQLAQLHLIPLEH